LQGRNLERRTAVASAPVNIKIRIVLRRVLEWHCLILGLDDHLPRDFKARDGSVFARFTDWNQEITIEPPAR